MKRGQGNHAAEPDWRVGKRMRLSASGVAPGCHSEGAVPTTLPSSVSMRQIDLAGRSHRDRIESVRVDASRARERTVDQSTTNAHRNDPSESTAVTTCRKVLTSSHAGAQTEGVARTSRERLHRRSRPLYSDRH
eukprot:829759-Pleurochrysis_carterae.AAC.1